MTLKDIGRRGWSCIDVLYVIGAGEIASQSCSGIQTFDPACGQIGLEHSIRDNGAGSKMISKTLTLCHWISIHQFIYQ